MDYLNKKISVGEIKREHGGNIHEFLKDNNGSRNEIIDFSANINPLGLSEEVKKNIIKNIDALVHYPEPYCDKLKKSLAQIHKIGKDNLLIGNGSIELIYLIPHALGIRKGLIITPSFSEYEFALRTKGVKPLFFKVFPDNNFNLDISKLEPFLKKTELIFLCNPNNPVGYLLSGQEIREFLKLCLKHKVIAIVDEAFMDFVQKARDHSLLCQAVKTKNLLVLRSMTKFFAFAGLRLGYVVGHKDLIRNISPFQYPWSVNSLAQTAAQTVVKDNVYIKKSVEYILREREYLFNNLESIRGIRLYRSCVNFIFCELTGNTVIDSKVLREKLIKRGIIIRDCGNFRGLNNKFFRVAVRRREENNRLIRAVKNIFTA